MIRSWCIFRNNTDLEYVLLNYNQIESLEDQFADLEPNTKLSWLELKNNKLTSLPKRFKNLIGLKVLDLEYNQITGLDNILKSMHQLTQLDLTGNRFKEVSILLVHQRVPIFWKIRTFMTKMVARILGCSGEIYYLLTWR